MIKHYDDLDDPRALVETAGEVLALYWYQRATAAEDALWRMANSALASDPASTPDRELSALK